MRAEDPGILKDKKAREELRTKYSSIIDDGIGHLNKALEIDKDYDDAMAYLNLLIREKARLLDDKDEYAKQEKVADDWLQKAMVTRKARAARQPSSTGGIIQDK